MGLEPTTPGVTGPYSNQLNYRTECSQLCVFLKRGCKDRYNFYFCKFFLKIFLKISHFSKTRKVTGTYIRPPSHATHCCQLFDLNDFMHLVHVGFHDFRDIHLEDAVFDLSIDLLPVGIVRQKHCLLVFAVGELAAEQ